MTTQSQDLTLRLSQCGKALPSVDLRQFIQTLVSELGEPLSEKKFRKLSPKKLFYLLSTIQKDVDRAQCNHAFAILTSQIIAPMSAPEVNNSTPLQGPKLRVAISSNSNEMLDGHFGSCLRMLVYEVNQHQFKLVDVRNVETHENGLARTDYLTQLITDCHLLGTLSIGGPAAAKVTRADIHPIKQAMPCQSSELLDRVQTVLKENPPKWIQKILDKQVGEA